MARIAHITKPREYIAERLSRGEKVEVEYTHVSNGNPDTKCRWRITHLMDMML